MRIISGLYKNRPLQSPKSIKTHPMGERERLAIFNMLGDLTDKTVLDLFAGTGALGLEALSRGAASATFVEKDPQVCQVLKANLTGISNAKILRADVAKYQPSALYDLVFIDPPYNIYDKTLVAKLAKYGKIAVVSMPKDGELPNIPITQNRNYANCKIIISML